MNEWQKRARVVSTARRLKGLTWQGLMTQLPAGLVFTEADVRRMEDGEHVVPDDYLTAVLRICEMPSDWEPELRDRIRAALFSRDELVRLTEHLNEQLRDLEDIFEKHFGETLEARVPLGETPRRDEPGPRRRPRAPAMFVFAGGFFHIEREGQRTVLLSSSREDRLSACSRIPDLWTACGGSPVPPAPAPAPAPARSR